MRKAKRNYREIYRQRERENERKREIFRFRRRRERIIRTRYIDRDKENLRDILLNLNWKKKEDKEIIERDISSETERDK